MQYSNSKITQIILIRETEKISLQPHLPTLPCRYASSESSLSPPHPLPPVCHCSVVTAYNWGTCLLLLHQPGIAALACYCGTGLYWGTCFSLLHPPVIAASASYSDTTLFAILTCYCGIRLLSRHSTVITALACYYGTRLLLRQSSVITALACYYGTRLLLRHSPVIAALACYCGTRR